MKKQIAIIHGGETFPSYRQYLDFLKTKEIKKESLKPKENWKKEIFRQMEGEFDVLLLRMPCKERASFKEWEIYFTRIGLLLEDGVALVGHSLGGLFLAKYLSRNVLPCKIRALFLVAAPFSEPGGKFNLPSSLVNLEKQVGEVFLFHSKDDPIVSIEALERWKKALPRAKIFSFSDRGHFLTDDFPELTREIKRVFR